MGGFTICSPVRSCVLIHSQNFAFARQDLKEFDHSQDYNDMFENDEDDNWREPSPPEAAAHAARRSPLWRDQTTNVTGQAITTTL